VTLRTKAIDFAIVARTTRWHFWVLAITFIYLFII